MDINVGDVVRLKKQHPCGSREWEVLRSGADFRLKCKGCGHQIMIARRLLEKPLKYQEIYVIIYICDESNSLLASGAGQRPEGGK